MNPNPHPLRVFHRNWTDHTATIFAEGLERPLRVLHLTDAHLSLMDDRDPQHYETFRNKAAVPGASSLSETGRVILPEDAFDQVLADAATLHVDLIALTGDLLQFPSQANLDRVVAALDRTGISWYFTAGNHDWHFRGQPITIETRAAGWRILARLYDAPPSCSCREIGGMQFLAVDNSNYQCDEEQFEFVRRTLATGRPTVLLIHIPLSTPTLREPTIRKWKNAILVCDFSWAEVDHDMPGTADYTASTLEFAHLVSAAPNLVAILCGHVHFPHADPVSPQAVQYVGSPGYQARYRLFYFQPYA